MGEVIENFIFALNAVAPLFGVMIVGYVLNQRNFFPDNMLAHFNTFVFKLALPLLLFRQSAATDFTAGTGMILPIFSVIFAIILTGVLCYIVPRFIKDAARAASFIQGVFRTNIALFGLPLAINLFGEAGSLDVVLVVAFLVPSFNVIAVVVLSSFSGGAHKPDIKEILKGIAQNRLIWGVVAGLAFAVAKIEVPSIILDPVNSIANTATPLAMLTLGGRFSFKSAAHNKMLIASASLLRLVVVPTIAVALGLLFGFGPTAIGALFICFGAPTATSSYIMAGSMGADAELAGEIVVFTTMLSTVSMFLGIVLLRSMGLI